MTRAIGEPGVDAAAGLIRDLFVRKYRAAMVLRTGRPCTWGDRPMPAWDGGYDEASASDRACVWPKIARFCRDHQCDPAAFVDAQFEGRPDLPRPSACHSEAALARYRAAAAGADDRLRGAYEAQRYTLRLEATLLRLEGVDGRAAVARVLADPRIELSGLFRHVIAAGLDFPEIAGRFRDAAFHQYLFRRDAYDRAWPGIPEPLRRAAADAVGDGRPSHAT